MSTPNYEPDDLISALREDLPSDADEHRARTRLLATGAALGGATIAHHLVSHVAELKSTTTLAAKLSAAFGKSAALVEGAANGVGLTIKVASWGMGTKSVIAVAAVAVAAGVPVAEHLRAVERTSASANPPEVTAPHRSATTATASAQSRDGAVVGEAGGRATPEVSDPARRSPAEPDEPIRPSLAAVIPPHEHLSADLNQAQPSQTAGRTMREPVARQMQADPAGPPARVQSARVAPDVAAPAAQTDPSPVLTRVDELMKSSAAMVQAPEAAQVQPASTLQAETHLLEQALTALGQSNNGKALSLLDEHQRRFPNGLLAPERLRLRARISEHGSTSSAQ